MTDHDADRLRAAVRARLESLDLDDPTDLGPDLLERLLADPDPRVRRALDATGRVLPTNHHVRDW